ncbi:hypothetical protein OHA72_45830 [Dactylosporangium sp. NBC_01737]|uniref:hypothetical protein n=1 Tax=Dactylosporangium sp. NBC_01737 TaxID=2975959 RepID=UPI002E134C70|nr:hypothetical protein OHA72_45830 [Dactylosporangium sp. NBC_01737]
MTIAIYASADGELVTSGGGRVASPQGTMYAFMRDQTDIDFWDGIAADMRRVARERGMA